MRSPVPPFGSRRRSARPRARRQNMPAGNACSHIARISSRCRCTGSAGSVCGALSRSQVVCWRNTDERAVRRSAKPQPAANHHRGRAAPANVTVDLVGRPSGEPAKFRAWILLPTSTCTHRVKMATRAPTGTHAARADLELAHAGMVLCIPGVTLPWACFAWFGGISDSQRLAGGGSEIRSCFNMAFCARCGGRPAQRIYPGCHCLLLFRASGSRRVRLRTGWDGVEHVADAACATTSTSRCQG